MRKCEVLELMELRMERMTREERHLRFELDSCQREISTLRTNRLQIEAEVV